MENNIICEIIGREKIKPSSPTPLHNKIYNLSWLDQISHTSFIPVLIFYNKPNNNNTYSQTSNLLKTSLSKTLTKYYPFAGTIRDRESILCDDQGVDFLEAKVKISLSSVVQNPKKETLDVLFPDNLQWRFAETVDQTLMAVQVNRFDCGGLAVAVCLSHKVSDAATLVSFLGSWSSEARNGGMSSLPMLNAAAIFPKGELPLFPEVTCRDRGRCSTRRFVFDEEKIGLLKRATHGGTRVEAVAALLFKSAVKASEINSDNPDIIASNSSSHILLHQVNLRTRTVPVLPENLVGNMVWFVPAVAPVDWSQMREKLTEYCDRYFGRFRGDNDVKDWCMAMKDCFEQSKSLMSKSGQTSYVSTSWCRFPIYGVDFGWGDPVWATTAGTLDKNVFVMMDTKCGNGIEAIVTLEEQEMCEFERDSNLLEFATCIA